MQQSEFIKDLQQQCREQITLAEKHLNQSTETLKQRANQNSWNAVECYAHLNLYFELYMDYFKQALNQAKDINRDKEIKRGYWGNKFIEMMDPQSDKMKKMKTFDSKNTLNQSHSESSIKDFIQYAKQLIEILDQSTGKDLQSAKCKLTVPIIKMKLSDAMQFILSHNKRHQQQAERAIML